MIDESFDSFQSGELHFTKKQENFFSNGQHNYAENKSVVTKDSFFNNTNEVARAITKSITSPQSATCTKPFFNSSMPIKLSETRIFSKGLLSAKNA